MSKKKRKKKRKEGGKRGIGIFRKKLPAKSNKKQDCPNGEKEESRFGAAIRGACERARECCVL
jgi:hypothetical protein